MTFAARSNAVVRPEQTDELAPQKRYTLVKVVAASTKSSPEIWRGRDSRLHCDVVIKRYPVDLCGECEREMALLNAGAPHVPKLIDAYVEDDGAFQTTTVSRIVGTPLSKIGAQPLAAALSIALAVVRVFHALHSMKPAGFALGCVGATDFLRDDHGNVWLIRCDDARLVDQVGLGDDIRTAGIIALGVLCGRPTTEATLDADLRQLPNGLAAVIERAVDPCPEARYASAQWFAQALDEQAGRFAGAARTTPDLPPPPRPIFRPIRIADSAVAFALSRLEGASSLEWQRIAHEGLLMSESGDESGLAALDTLDIDRYPHQIHAAASVIGNTSMDAGAILADEVGLGKTIEALMVCQELRARGQAESVLIVASPTGAPQWFSETRLRLRRNAYERGFRIYESAKDAGYPLLIVSSATLRQDRRLAQLLDRRFDLVIVDEAHQCCAGAGRLSTLGRAVERLDHRRLLLLTATPLGNRLWDLYTLADMIRPGMLGTPKQFAAEFTGAGSRGRFVPEAAVRTLRAKMQSLMVRHKRTDLQGVITPKIECAIEYIPERGIGKIPAAAQIVCDRWAKERVVLFAREPAIRAALAKAITAHSPGRAVIEFQGNRRQSRAQEREFNEFANAVMISGDTVAEGMNWQRARCMLHFDPPLTPIAWEQRVGRIFRLGQRADRLEIVHLATQGSAEAKVLALYDEALGLFSLPIGETSVVLDYLSDVKLRNLESPVRALLRARQPDEDLTAALGSALRAARRAYDQNAGEAAVLDDIFFGGGRPA